MKKRCQHIGLKALAWVVVTLAVALGLSSGAVYAQTFGEYFLAALPVSLGGFERYIEPLMPVDIRGSTFRSETGVAIVGAYPRYIMLRGRVGGELDLTDAMPMDEYPFRHDFYTKLQIWRLGLKATYTDFDALNQQRNRGKFDFSGVTLGCDVDLVSRPWFNAGLGVEYHFNQPRLHSAIYPDPDNPSPSSAFMMDIEGDRPITVGAYARYVPPEILGFPVHGEAYFKLPVHGSKLTSVGGSLVFRPQIYRFDLGARFNFEKCWLSFEKEYVTSVQAVNNNWRLDTEWEFYGIEWLIYF